MKAEIAYIGLGSNLGDRVSAIDAAAQKLITLPGTSSIALSGLYETSAVGMEGKHFINAVAEVRTGMGPLILLRTLLNVETDMGRTREPGITGSRFIDLDLLLYGETEVSTRNLTVPHPRMFSRRFVLEPLAELAPDLFIPPLGITASEAALAAAKRFPDQEVRRLGTLEEVRESLRFEV